MPCRVIEWYIAVRMFRERYIITSGTLHAGRALCLNSPCDFDTSIFRESHFQVAECVTAPAPCPPNAASPPPAQMCSLDQGHYHNPLHKSKCPG